jgi:replicative DNA helicase
MTDKTPSPLFDVELEKSTLGTILLDPASLDEFPAKAEDFYIERHQTIFKAINSLMKSDGAVDYILLVNKLKENGALSDVGGSSYITDIMSTSASTLYMESYVNKLKNLSRRRELLRAANDIAKKAMQLDEDIDKYIPGMVESLVNSASTSVKVYHISEVLSELYDRVMDRYNRYIQAVELGLPFDEIWGLKTGFMDYDQITGGVSGADMTLITGESGVGKTKLMGQICHNLATQEPGIFFSIEMDRFQVELRELSKDSRLATRKLKTGAMTEAEVFEMTASIGRLEKLQMFICDPSDLSTAQLRSVITQYKNKFGIKWFALDYLYLLSDGQGLDENNKTLTISAALKRTCKSVGLPGLIIHSLNKSGEMRGSAQVKYDCDLQLDITEYKEIPSMNLYLSEVEKSNMVTCAFKKGRELDGARAFHLVKDSDNGTNFPAFRNFDWKGRKK